MMINTVRTVSVSFPSISRCHRAVISKTKTLVHQHGRKAVPSPDSFPNSNSCCASFSSVAPPQLQTPVPIHPHTSPPASVSPLRVRGSSVNSTMDPALLPEFNDSDSDCDSDCDADANAEVGSKKESGRIRNIRDFVDRIPEAVHLRKTKNIEPGALDDPVARLFRLSDLPPHAWQKYALFDTNKPYTRNLVSTDDKTYTLLVLCWNPEQESPIHDHPCDGCWLQVLEGGIREVRYDKQLNRTSQMDYQHEGDLSYITDNVGYHKVGNPTQKPAVTLHLYAPPFDSCQCWHSDNGDPSEPSEGKNVNHSEYGVLKAA